MLQTSVKSSNWYSQFRVCSNEFPSHAMECWFIFGISIDPFVKIISYFQLVTHEIHQSVSVFIGRKTIILHLVSQRRKFRILARTNEYARAGNVFTTLDSKGSNWDLFSESVFIPKEQIMAHCKRWGKIKCPLTAIGKILTV